MKSIVTHTDWIDRKQKFNGESVKETKNTSNWEVELIGSIEKCEILRFYVLLENMNKFLQQQSSRPKFTYARRRNCPEMFYKIFACTHYCSIQNFYANLNRVNVKSD